MGEHLKHAGVIPEPPQWPHRLTQLTQEIERARRRDEMADGSIFIFGVSMVFLSLSDLPVEERQAKFNELIAGTRAVLFPPQEPPDGD
jgi:hypothetical protein